MQILPGFGGARKILDPGSMIAPKSGLPDVVNPAGALLDDDRKKAKAALQPDAPIRSASLLTGAE
jgi:hypothetical protein